MCIYIYICIYSAFIGISLIRLSIYLICQTIPIIIITVCDAFMTACSLFKLISVIDYRLMSSDIRLYLYLIQKILFKPI